MNEVKYYRLNQCGILEIKTCNNQLHRIKEHLHEELSIGIIEKGTGQLIVDGESYNVKKGDVFLISPFRTHACLPNDTADWQYTILFIKNDYYDQLESLGKIPLKSLNDFAFQNICELVHRFRFNNIVPQDKLQMDEFIKAILKEADKEVCLHTNKKLQQVKEFIENYYASNFTIKNLVDQFGIQQFTLIKAFRRYYNTTPIAYKIQLRLDHAKHLLRSEENISKVAALSGFYDQAQFTKEFRKIYGVTPQSYQLAATEKSTD
ncbi:MAG: AraC family transcriptional regulator [Bacillota bacterium]|nr:AraC family transcriptional regulator [Bacillota bacterium]